MGVLYLGFVLLLVTATTTAAADSVAFSEQRSYGRWVEWAVKRTETTGDAYIDMLIGNPPVNMKMVLDGSSDTSAFWGPASLAISDSPSAYQDGKGLAREWVKMGERVYHLSFVELSPSDVLNSAAFPAGTDGRLGLGRGSEIWRLWQGMLIENSRFLLYKARIPPRIGTVISKTRCLPRASGPVCAFETGDGTRVILFSNDSFTRLPPSSYRETLKQRTKRVSQRATSMWGLLDPSADLDIVALASGMYSLAPEHYETRSGRLMLKRSEKEGTLELGAAFTRAYSVHVDIWLNEVLILKLSQGIHLSGWELALIIICSLLFVMWLLTPVAFMLTFSTGKVTRVTLQLLTMIITSFSVAIAYQAISDGKSAPSGWGTFIGVIVFKSVFLGTNLALLFIANMVYSEEEQGASPRAIVNLNKLLHEQSALLATWALLQKSVTIVLSVYASLLFSVFIAGFSLFNAWLLLDWFIHKRLASKLDPLARASAIFVLVLQLSYAAWALGFLFWFAFAELAQLHMPAYTGVFALIGIATEMAIARYSLSVSTRVIHSAEGPFGDDHITLI